MCIEQLLANFRRGDTIQFAFCNHKCLDRQQQDEGTQFKGNQIQSITWARGLSISKTALTDNALIYATPWMHNQR